jgi:hypothetical protein
MHHRRLRIVEDCAVLRLLAPRFLARGMKQLVAEVPAARPLQQIAADRRRVADLRSRGMSCRGSERRIVATDRCIARDLGKRGEGAETQPRRLVKLHAAQRIDALQVDDSCRRDDAFLHQIEQVEAAGLRDRAGCRQQRDCFLYGPRIDPLQGAHACSSSSLRSSARRAASTFAGVIGNVRMRLPVAL